MTEIWVRTDEATDVAGSIRHVVRTADFVRDDPQAWKWVILALHSALQGACVCHLTTTAAPLGAVTKRNAAEWINYFERPHAEPRINLPETHLMPLPDLLKAVRKPNSAGDGSKATGVKISDRELRWLVRFHSEIRNQFTHFEPLGWSIEMSGIPDIARLVARIVDQIIEHGWGFRHVPDERRQELKRDLRTIAAFKWPLSSSTGP